MRVTALLLIFLIACTLIASGQLDITTSVDPEIDVCRNSASMEITLHNTTGTSVSFDSIQVALPQGISYLTGSLLNLNGTPLTESNISSPGQVAFSSGSVASTDSLKFQISYTAGIPAIDFQDLGNIFKNTVTIYDNGSALQSELSNGYNILYPVFSITSLSPGSQTFVSGLNTTRTITIVNAGFGATDEIKISDIPNSSLLLLESVDIGTINGDTITLSGSDFSGIGNGDNVFDNNEALVITEVLTGTSCTDITISSAIEVHWGCQNELKSSSTSYGNTTIDFQSPNIALSATSELSSCFENDQASAHTLTLTNNGSGVANNVLVDIYKSTGGNYNQSIFSRFDISSVYYTVGVSGTPIYPSVTSTATDITGLYSVLGANAKGRFEFVIPAIAPDEIIVVHWNSYSKVSGTCQDEMYMGWKAEVDYTDVCATSTYSKSNTGQSTNSQYMTMFTETPLNIQAGVSEDYSFIISSFDNTLPSDLSVEGQYKFEFTLDADLQYQTLSLRQNNIDWTPSNIIVSGNTVSAYFDSPAPFDIPKSELLLTLAGNCGNPGYKNIELDVSYLPDATCSPEFSIPMICDETVTTRLHCPVLNCEGFHFLSFDTYRKNLGSSDNNLDGNADATSSIDYTKIKRNRLMTGDTLETVLKAFVETSVSNPDFANFFVETDVELGTNLSFLTASIEIYDTYSSASYTCSTIQVDSVDNGNDRKYRFSFIPSIHCPSIPNAGGGFVFKEGDSVTFTVNYRLSGNIGPLTQEVTLDNDLFASSLTDPWGTEAASLSSDKWSCEDYDERITFIGHTWINQSANNFTVKNCSKYAVQDFGLSIGDCCSNYGGGNLFPFEYRHWGILKEVKMVKPSNYDALTTKLQLYNTKKTNSTVYKQITITPDAVSGDTLYYDIEQYYTSGLLSRSDDGFNGKFKVELAPDCNTPQNNFEEIHWFFNYEESEAINAEETGYLVSSGPDKIKYLPAAIEITAANPIQDAYQRDVSWSIGIKNASSSGTSNTWLHLDVPTNLTITAVETAAGAPLSYSGDLYEIGTVGANSTENIIIYGRISNCDTVEFIAHSGFNCTSLPATFADVNCNYDTKSLYVESKRSNFQTRIKALQSGDICGQFINLEIDISSVEIAHMYDMKIRLDVQDTLKIKVVEDSSMFLYPNSGIYTPISTPSFDGVGYNYEINDFESSFAQDGIPGVLNLNANRYKLKVTLKLQNDFIPGDAINLKIDGQNACAEDLKTINLTFDPNSMFTKNTVSGLHIDISNSWTASWGDYDNDGYDDIFIPTYDANEQNMLYHNNGDGTFTSITSGPVVTTLGSAVSGTWADFDNDGDLDLFVAYNSSGEDKLFTNNGNGTFSSSAGGDATNSGLYTHGAAWGDYDNDGYLDLILSDFHLTNSNSLIHNNGDGTFERVDNSPISLETSSSVSANWADYDNDGDLDVFIANTEHQNNLLYENVNGAFEKVLTGPVVNDGGTSVGGTWGDLDNDGDLDLFVANSSDQDPNFLYLNNGDGTFTKNTTSALVQDSVNSHGAAWCDYDNDGDLDLFVANNLGVNFLFSNDGLGNFVKLSNAMTDEVNSSYGAAWSDYDNDGDYDLIIANQGANANDFFTNEKGNCHNHLAIRLTGCHTNTFGIGAKIKVKATINGVDVWQTREVSSQNNGLGGQSSLKTIVGVQDATVIDSIIVLWPSGVRQVLTDHVVNQEVTFVEDCGSKVCGYVYYDENMNGIKDPEEIGLSNQLVSVEPYNNFVFTTNSEGYYQTYMLDGVYDISYVTNPDWSEVDDTMYSITVNTLDATDYCGNDFGVTPTCVDSDLELQMSAGAFRRGLQNELNVSVTNKGVGTAIDAVVTVTISENVALLDGADSFTNLNGENIYTFNIGDLAPFEDTLLALTDSVSVLSELDDLVTLTIDVSSSSAECSAANNQVSLTDLIVGSIDPNEKYILNDGGNPFESMFTLGDTLYYKIAFQNVGNYPAQRVVIVDTLSELFDLSSVRLINSSHPMTFVQKGNILQWSNEDIQLVDSTTNEEESHGFVMFQILTIPSLEPYTQIDNVAQIQFDYNHFIVTNNTEAISVPKNQIENAEVIIFPNPVTHISQVLLLDLETQKRKNIESVSVYDIGGNLVYQANVNSDKAMLGDNLRPGEYNVVLLDSEGQRHSGKLIRL